MTMLLLLASLCFAQEIPAELHARMDYWRSWDEIEKKYSPDWPVLKFRGHEVSARKLCVEGDHFELAGFKKTIDVCRDERYCDGPCLGFEQIRVSIPLEYEVETCPGAYQDDDPCRGPGVKKKVRRPTSYRVDVYRRDVHEDRVPLFAKAYSIPNCSETTP
jgi:hypothetical protein